MPSTCAASSSLLDYLRDGGELEPLFVGKIAADHVPIIGELQWRKVLRDPPAEAALPGRPGSARAGWNSCAQAIDVLDLIKGGRR